jgi:hypothetical protein
MLAAYQILVHFGHFIHTFKLEYKNIFALNITTT